MNHKEVWVIYNCNGILLWAYNSKIAAEFGLTTLNDPSNNYQSAPYTIKHYILSED